MAQSPELSALISPYRHSRESWLMSQRRALRPIVVPVLDIPRAELYACRSSHICCRLTGTGCSRRSSRAIFVHWNEIDD